jgi:hypothetical protein
MLINVICILMLVQFLILIISYLLFRVQDDDLEEKDSIVHVIKNYSKSTSKKVSDET